jgi:hypothetical protein
MTSQTSGAVSGASSSWPGHVGNAMVAFIRSASVTLPGLRTRMSSADGRRPAGVFSAWAVWVARGCSPFHLGETLVS